ncbi:MAG: phosphotransferase [Trueperaceae bacterium]|nr:phosphotransferase [Trueperaceae bacterium]
MMNLDLMWRVLAYLSNDTSHLIKDMLNRWTTNPKDIRFFRASSNFVFSFQMANQPYFLRFSSAREKDAVQIEQELNFIRFLDAGGLKVARPVPSLSGTLLEQVSSPLGVFHAVVFEGLTGEHYDLDELSEEQLVIWGAALGGLHKASSSYPANLRPSWQSQLAWICESLPQTEQRALHFAHTLRQDLSRLPVSSDNYGLIHYDFEPDNLIWQGNNVQILDFDDCMNSWFAADIISALSDLFDNSSTKITLDNSAFQLFLKGYQRVKALPSEDLDFLSLFLHFENLLKFTKILCSRENLDTEHCPEWAHQLDRKLENRLESYRKTFA